MKVAVVGGGSTYTPELVDGVARLAGSGDLAAGLEVTELTLVDPDTDRLAVVGPVSARIMSALGHPGRVTWTTSLDEGLDGAGAVLLQLRVGGQAARDRDETWPLDYGCVGQETLARAAWPRRCARCRWCWRSPSGPGAGPSHRPGSWTSPTRSGS
jgi:6-phospho-beta-glucosidase